MYTRCMHVYNFLYLIILMITVMGKIIVYVSMVLFLPIIAENNGLFKIFKANN